MTETTPPANSSDSASSSSAWRTFGIPALLAIVGYVCFYACDARLRHHRGPWEVTFLREPDGAPALRIRQESLGISNVLIRFVTTTQAAWTHDLPEVVRFDEPDRTMPFGELVFHDLMYQPGTIVLQCFGHEVQLLPRALFLDRRETPWQGEARLVLGTNSPSSGSAPAGIPLEGDLPHGP